MWATTPGRLPILARQTKTSRDASLSSRPQVDTSKPWERFTMLGGSGVPVLNAAVGEDAWPGDVWGELCEDFGG